MQFLFLMLTNIYITDVRSVGGWVGWLVGRSFGWIYDWMYGMDGY